MSPYGDQVTQRRLMDFSALSWQDPVETAVMRHWEPPLNLTGVSTAWTNQVKTARSVMAEQAKAWALKRGFHV